MSQLSNVNIASINLHLSNNEWKQKMYLIKNVKDDILRDVDDHMDDAGKEGKKHLKLVNLERAFFHNFLYLLTALVQLQPLPFFAMHTFLTR